MLAFILITNIGMPSTRIFIVLKQMEHLKSQYVKESESEWKKEVDKLK